MRPSAQRKVNYSDFLGPMSTFSVFKDGDTVSRDCLWAPVPVSDLSNGKFLFHHIESEFHISPFMFILSRPFAIYILEETGYMLSVPSHRVAEDNSKVPHKSSFLQPEYNHFIQLLL